ncbi:MAG TPA: hypothetical protein VFQ54_12155, partial [Thermomicrobiales bacterium]|nr:hypothetical protein [Thermomicrobiales bacterium]
MTFRQHRSARLVVTTVAAFLLGMLAVVALGTFSSPRSALAADSATPVVTATTTPRLWTLDLVVETQDSKPIPVGAKICLTNTDPSTPYSSCLDVSSGTAHYVDMPFGSYGVTGTGLGHYHLLDGIYIARGFGQPDSWSV